MIIKSNKNSSYSCVCEKKIPKGDCIYCLKIYDSNLSGDGILIKVGTTNNIERRMKEHLRYYKCNIDVLWISPEYSKYTTLRVEDRTKEKWKKCGYSYINSDRFVVPKETKKVVIKVRKEYEVYLE